MKFKSFNRETRKPSVRRFRIGRGQRKVLPSIEVTYLDLTKNRKPLPEWMQKLENLDEPFVPDERKGA